MDTSVLQKEDYVEPCCPFTAPTDVRTVPIGRIIDKLDEYLGRNDYASAQRHLAYWLEEADMEHDRRGRLSILNEQIGLYRKLGNKDACYQAIDGALSLIPELGLEANVTAGTTYVNAATGYKAFGEPQRALPLYRQARAIYEKELKGNDLRLGGLYNNMALTLTDLRLFTTAKEMYEMAMEVMAQVEHGELEIAISCCNLADLTAAQLGISAGKEQIDSYLRRAASLLDTQSLPRNGYYAFVCDKCAPTFGHYGFPQVEETLRKRVKEIYDRA